LWVFSAGALETLPLLEKEPARALLGKKPIEAKVSGSVDVGFERMLALYESPSMVLRIQQVYRDYVVGDEGVEFEVEEVAPGRYEYVNRKGEQTMVEEVYRARSNTGGFDLVLYTAGQRFFGAYEAVIHIELQRGDGEQCEYRAVVYAYPKNSLSRFLGRHLGLVEGFFKRKTVEMEALTVEVCGYMDQPVKVGR
jgi:hypothetical protein